MTRNLWSWMQIETTAIRPGSRTSYDTNFAYLSGVRPINGGLCDNTGTWVQNPARYDLTLKAAVHAAGQTYMPLVGVNSSADFYTVLDSPALTATSISNLVTLATTRAHDGPWDGVDFDLEGLDDSYKNKLTAWYEIAIPALQAQGLAVNITYLPPTMDVPPGAGTERLVHDVAALAPLADTITLMFYPQGCTEWTPHHAPGAMAFERKALDYVLGKGVDPDQLIGGFAVTGKYYQDAAVSFPSYAYCQAVLTAAGQETRWAEFEASERASLHNAAWVNGVVYDLWTIDERSLPIHLNLVEEYGLAGACFFVLGSETSAIWPIVSAWQAGTMPWHGYIVLERVAMAAPDFATLYGYAEVQGQEHAQYPSRLNHWRLVDANTIIIEAEFGTGEMSVDHCDDWLGAILDVAVGSITHTNSSVTYVTLPTPVTLFSHGGTDYFRLRIFGGSGATWAQSLIEVQGYL